MSIVLPPPPLSQASAIVAATPTTRPLPAWKIWENPIWRRYCRSRLRPQGLAVWLTLTLLLAGFLFFILRTVTVYRGGMAAADAERAPILPVLGIGGFILFVLGTGQVAAGMTAEADEGVLDYQRLTPLTPLTKVLGFLFGLPVREWLMFAVTLPFIFWGLLRGGVPLMTWLPLGVVFVCSALLYHLTGLVAGTVVKNRRWAFLLSIGTVFLLYTVVPQAARFGLVFFKYFTLSPVLQEALPNMVPGNVSTVAKMRHALMPEVRFFGLHFSETAFTLFTQGALILTFLAMLWRRWRRAEAHLLGKRWAVALFAWVQVLFLGNALPLIESGLLFPTREVRRRLAGTGVAGDWKPQLAEAVGMIGVYGLVTLALMAVLTVIITPTADGQLRGWRRARKLGWRRIPPFSDAAGAFPFVAVMAVIGAVGWTLFARGLVESKWFHDSALPAHAGPTFALVLLGAGLGFHALLEGGGGRWAFFAVLFLGVVPVMVGSILGAASNALLTTSTWLAGVSPLSAPFYAAQTLVRANALAGADAVPGAFWFWLAVTALATGTLVIWLWRIRKRRRTVAASTEKEELAT